MLQIDVFFTQTWPTNDQFHNRRPFKTTCYRNEKTKVLLYVSYFVYFIKKTRTHITIYNIEKLSPVVGLFVDKM